MATNILLTGPPRIGKTTVIQRVIDRLTDEGYHVGGVYCPECRVNDERIGIDLVDAMTGEIRTLAHVGRTDGPKVGRYRVNVDNVDTMYTAAFDRAFEDADVVIADEIAPMQLHSEVFPDQVRRILDAELPVVGTIADDSAEGFIGEIKRREDTELIEVTEQTREELPGELTDTVSECL